MMTPEQLAELQQRTREANRKVAEMCHAKAQAFAAQIQTAQTHADKADLVWLSVIAARAAHSYQ